MVEIFFGVIAPLVLFAYAIRNEKVGIIRFTALMTVIGVVLNRVNTAMITFNWKLAEREIPHWREVLISITIFAIYITVYRFILYRLPILYTWKTADEPAVELAHEKSGSYGMNNRSIPQGTYRTTVDNTFGNSTFKSDSSDRLS
jgi:hypothetical protein